MSISELEDRKTQLIEYIANLNSMENDLYQQLDNTQLTAAQRTAIANKISNISQMRIDLYAMINTLYEYYTTDSSSISNILNEQDAAIKIIESELNQNNERLSLLKNQKNDKVRLIENNTYYGKYYNAHKQIMITVVLICVPILILIILGNMGLFPPNLNAVLIMIIIIIGSISVGYQIIDLSNRDNMNFDEYNWKFNKKLAPEINTVVQTGDTQAVITGQLLQEDNFCQNDECCPEDTTTNTYAYSAIENRCIGTPI
jgi:hypothetical protein